MLRQGGLGGVQAQIQMQALVAERGLGALHGADLVGYVDHVEVRLHDLRHLLQLVLIQADHAHAYQVGDVGADFIGNAAFFQRRAVLARELAQTFVAVFHAAFDLGYVDVARLRKNGLQQILEKDAGLLQGRALQRIEGVEGGFLACKMGGRRHAVVGAVGGDGHHRRAAGRCLPMVGSSAFTSLVAWCAPGS